MAKGMAGFLGTAAAYACMVGCAMALGWFAHVFFGSSSSTRTRAAPALPAVAVGEVAQEIFNPSESFIGHVEPVQEVDILPQIEGYVKVVRFKEGDAVKVGDLLYEIDPERYTAAERVARAELAQARSKVAQCAAAVDRATRYLKRLRGADARGITQTQLDDAETGCAAEEASLASARAAVSQAEANVALTAFNLKHTRIHAPISGRIGKSLRYAGDYVSPSKGALARIVQMDPVRVSFPITDRAALAWQRKAHARGASLGDTRRLRLLLADGTVYPRNGRWAFLDNEMSTETATLLVRALFPNPQRTLVPNAYVTVLADASDPQPLTVVPASAVAVTGRTSGVWVLGADDKVSFREVALGARADGKVHVKEGVAPGEKIVVQGIHKLSEGSRVKVVPASVFQ